MSREFTLDAIDLILCRAALHELAARHADAEIGPVTEAAENAIRRGLELVEPERGVTVLALRGYGIRHGVVAFAGVVSVSRKIGLEAALKASIKEYIKCLEQSKAARQ